MTGTLKNKFKNVVALTLAASFLTTTALPIAQAEAGQRHWRGDHRPVVVKKYRGHRKNRNHGGEALAAGILGFAIGAIIADQANRPRTVYPQPRRVYVQPRPVYRPQPQPIYVAPPTPRYEPYVERRPLNDPYDRPTNYTYDRQADYPNSDEPRVIRYEDELAASYEPWSREWASWCDNKYRSFNANTGTFRGYDGKDHFCVVK